MAALKDATTGYDTVADFFDTTPQPDSAASNASLEDPASYLSFTVPSFALINAETGYDSVADWFDTTPQPDFAASLASLMFHYESGFGIIEGRFIETGTGSKETWGIVGE